MIKKIISVRSLGAICVALLFPILGNEYLNAQNIGINTSGNPAAVGAGLDVDFSNKGLLIPRVSLSANNDIMGNASMQTSTIIYKKDLVGWGAAIGYYYWSGSIWVPLSVGGGGWSLLGNSGTQDGTNFLGTTDDVPFTIRVNNVRAGRIDNATGAKFNTSLGYLAGGGWIATSLNNTAMGYNALKVSTGSYNTAIGNDAQLTNSTGRYNTSVGSASLYSNSTGEYNTAVGYGALQTATASRNTAVGHYALYGNLGVNSASDNTALGHWSLYNVTTGASNTAVGGSALMGTLTGANNTAVGFEALFGNKSSGNTALGYRAGYAVTTGGTNNILLGYQAGDAITTGDNNIIIGYDIDAPVATNSQQLSIGNMIYATGMNGTGTTASTGNVGIGNSAPGVKLDILAPDGAARVLSGAAGNYASISVGRTAEEGTIGVAAAAGHWDGAAVAGDVIIRTAAGALRFNTSNGGGTSPFTILGGNGHVGIATTAPSERLHVVHSQNAKSRIYLQNATAGTDAAAELFIRRANNNVVSLGIGDPTYNVTTYPADFRGAYMYTDAAEGFAFRADNASAPIRFLTNGSGVPTEYMRITPAGTVGIGTTTPSRIFEIHGKAFAAYAMFHTNFSGNTATDGLEVSLGVANEAFVWNYENSYMQFATNNTARMIILANGNVGIGNAIIAPGELLEVGSADATIRVRNTNDVGGGFTGNTWNSMQLGMYNPSAGAWGVIAAGAKRSFFGFDINGNVGSLTNLFGSPVFRNKLDDGSGNMICANDVYISDLTACGSGWVASMWCSDGRFKKDILPIKQALSKVMKLEGVSYFFKVDQFPEKHLAEGCQVGLIAQEVEKIVPEVVGTGDDGYKMIRYDKMVPVLIEAIKEQQAMIEMLKNERSEQQDQIGRQNERLEKLEALMNVAKK